MLQRGALHAEEYTRLPPMYCPTVALGSRKRPMVNHVPDRCDCDTCRLRSQEGMLTASLAALTVNGNNNKDEDWLRELALNALEVQRSRTDLTADEARYWKEVAADVYKVAPVRVGNAAVLAAAAASMKNGVSHGVYKRTIVRKWKHGDAQSKKLRSVWTALAPETVQRFRDQLRTRVPPFIVTPDNCMLAIQYGGCDKDRSTRVVSGLGPYGQSVGVPNPWFVRAMRKEVANFVRCVWLKDPRVLLPKAPLYTFVESDGDGSKEIADRSVPQDDLRVGLFDCVDTPAFLAGTLLVRGMDGDESPVLIFDDMTGEIDVIRVVSSSVKDACIHQGMVGMNAEMFTPEGRSIMYWTLFGNPIFAARLIMDLMTLAPREMLSKLGTQMVDDLHAQPGRCAFCLGVGDGPPTTAMVKCQKCYKVQYCGDECAKAHWELVHASYCLNIEFID